MNRINYFAILLIMFSTIGCGGSGGNTAVPTILSLKDAADAVIEPTGTTSVNPTSFTVTFDEPMDEDSVGAAGNITFNCDDIPSGLAQPAIEIQRSDADGKVYTTAVTDPYKYQLKTCTLSFTTNITSNSGIALGSAASYTFTNGCALNDDFYADSQGCWTVLGSGEVAYTWRTWTDILANALNFNTANGTLDYDDSRNSVDNNSFAFYKAATTGTGPVSITVHFKSASNLTATTLDGVDIVLISPNLSGAYYTISLAGSNQQEQQCTVNYFVSFGAASSSTAQMSCGTGEHLIRITHTAGSSVVCEHSTDGSSWDSIPIATGIDPMPAIDTSGSKILIVAFGNGGSNHDGTAEIDSIKVSNMTSDDQY